jgi:hypothetical protein
VLLQKPGNILINANCDCKVRLVKIPITSFRLILSSLAHIGARRALFGLAADLRLWDGTCTQT